MKHSFKYNEDKSIASVLVSIKITDDAGQDLEVGKTTINMDLSQLTETEVLDRVAKSFIVPAQAEIRQSGSIPETFDFDCRKSLDGSGRVRKTNKEVAAEMVAKMRKEGLSPEEIIAELEK